MAQDRIKAVLLDLDDTLLINDMETFSPPYFRALLAKVQGVCRPGLVRRGPEHGYPRHGRRTTAVVRRTLRSLHASFTPGSPVPATTIEPLLDDFYRHEFEDLAYLTAPDPAARELVIVAAGERASRSR